MTKVNFQVRYASESDVRHFYKDEFKKSVRALVLEKDGELVGIAGVTVEKDNMLAFSKMKGGEIPPKLIISCARLFKDFLEALGHKVVAVASDDYKNSAKLLERVGFQYAGIQNNQRVYVWQIR